MEGSLGGACWRAERSRSGAVSVLERARSPSASWEVEDDSGPTAGAATEGAIAATATSTDVSDSGSAICIHANLG